MKNTSVKILIADDDKDIHTELKPGFETNGFTVYSANDGIQALKLAKQYKPDILLLDISMPNLEGTSVCEILRAMPEFKNTPIIFLTNQSGEAVESKALRIGGDDFLVKPAKFSSLLIRVTKLLELKRKVSLVESRITEINSTILNHETGTLLYKGKPTNLVKKEFQLVEMLATKAGKVFTRAEILNTVWATTKMINDRTIDVHVRKIRMKTSDKFITTIKGVGFKLSP